MIDKRFSLYKKDTNKVLSSFTQDVQFGLASSPKFLLPKYFYDDLGSILFEAITLLPEYYPTRKEKEILSECATEVLDLIQDEVTLVELGSGSSSKTRYLIEAILRRQSKLTYIPIEISQSAVESSSKQLLDNYPNLKIEAYIGDYLNILEVLKLNTSKRILILFLGSSIGNLSPEESIRLLEAIRQNLLPNDSLLLGADLKKSTEILESAYDDALGVTAAFNLNILARLNRELNADFNICSFKHVAFYNSNLGRIEMHLESRCSQTAFIKNLNQKVIFAEGERIHTENSYKYDTESLRSLARQTGFELKQIWHDQQLYFSNSLFVSTSIS